MSQVINKLINKKTIRKRKKVESEMGFRTYQFIYSKNLIEYVILVNQYSELFWSTILLLFIFIFVYFFKYDVEEYRKRKEITVRGSGCPKAVTNFHQAQFPREFNSHECVHKIFFPFIR